MSALQRSLIRALTLLLVTATLALGVAGTASAARKVAAVATPGDLSGAITTSDGGDFTGTLTAYLWSDDNEFVFWDSVSFDGKPSPQNYSFTDIADGDYYVEYVDESDTYATGYGNGATGRPSSPGDPGTVHVTSAVGATANVALSLLPPRHQVTGTVDDAADQSPVPDVYVIASILTGGSYEYATEGMSDENGLYTLDLRPGSYELYFSDINGLHQDKTVTKVVSGSTTSLGNVSLEPISDPTVSGQILGSDAQALPRAQVKLLKLLGEPDAFYDAVEVRRMRADANGNYSFDDVPMYEYYTVQASGYRHTAAVLGGGTNPLEGGSFYLEGDYTADDLQLTQLAPGLRGTVTSAYGAVGNVDVQLFQWLEGDGFFDLSEIATTDATGQFSFDQLAPGDYTLLFDSAAANKPVRTQWLEGTDVPSSPSASGVIHVTGTPTDNVRNKTLTALQVARGILRTGGGAALADGSVTTFRWTGSAWTKYATVATGPDGGFEAAVPPSATVTFQFSRTGYQTRFLGGSTAKPASPTPANSVQTAASGDVDLDPEVQVLNVAKVSSTTAAKLAKAKITVGKSTKVTITVKAPGVSAPTGKVQVHDGKKLLKTVTIAAAKRGVVVVALTRPAKGKHKISATYLGSDTVGGSTSKQVILTVKKKR
ncbi:MAG: carboxypeptidase regulatory-like domain-containing protein [Nocardioides sp.]